MTIWAHMESRDWIWFRAITKCIAHLREYRRQHHDQIPVNYLESWHHCYLACNNQVQLGQLSLTVLLNNLCCQVNYQLSRCGNESRSLITGSMLFLLWMRTLMLSFRRLLSGLCPGLQRAMEKHLPSSRGFSNCKI